ncbi:MAG: DUF3775 domain-containing protein [Gemmataceae bacterium]
MTLSRVIQEAIPLADAVRKYWSTELPKWHPNYPMVGAGEKSPPPPPERKKLRELLTRQAEDTIYQLLLVMYLGRGDFGPGELAEHFESLKEQFATPREAIAQLMGKAPLGDYLAEGLSALNQAGLDPDRLALTPARSTPS